MLAKYCNYQYFGDPKNMPMEPLSPSHPEVMTFQLLDYVIKAGNKSLQTFNIHDRDWILRTYADCLQFIDQEKKDRCSTNISYAEAAQ